MDESIFQSIKALLGPDASYEVFDQDILIHINTAVATLTQIGVGPSSGITVTDETTWSDLIGDVSMLNMVRSYIYMKVRIAFDPPSNSSTLKAYQDACAEYEWRMNVAVDPELTKIL